MIGELVLFQRSILAPSDPILGESIMVPPTTYLQKIYKHKNAANLSIPTQWAAHPAKLNRLRLILKGHSSKECLVS